MDTRSVVRKPIIAAVLAALVVALPMTIFYYAEVRPAAAAAAVTTTAPLVDPPAQGTPASVVPDFSAMVRRYGPAVVNISVVSKPLGASSGGERDGPPESQDPFGPNDPLGPNTPFGPTDPFAPFFRGLPHMPRTWPPPAPVRGEGSGFIVRSDGLILTNAHVVNGASEVTVRLTDRREYTAKVIGTDTRSDIAVIKVNAKDLPTVRLGDSKTLKVGEWVLAIGAPFGFENSATQGIVSAKGRTLPDSGYVPFIQTDVPINPGNSGGPLFNMQGDVIGINSQIYSQTGGYMGLSFAIPIEVVLKVSHQLETTGHVTRGKLGVVIQEVSQGLADSFGLPQPEGALVSSVENGSPAEAAGIRAGDVILKLNAEPVRDSTELPVRIAEIAPGTAVDLEIWRDHAVREVRVTLTAMEDARAAARGSRDNHGGKLGLAVRPLTQEEKRSAKTDRGVMVERSTGPAAVAGIQPGDVVLSVNGSPISGPEDLRKAVEKSKGHAALLVQRGDTRLFVAISIG